ncbi:MAG: DNA-binding transcriptional ArsR family regulator [Crocinitomix sp.]|jgi:DNA-binding transcriptional ArsR family regulator
MNILSNPRKHLLQSATCNFRIEKVSTFYNEVNQFPSLRQQIRATHEKTLKVLVKKYGEKLDSFFKSSNRYNNPIDHPEALMVAEQLCYFAKCCRISKRQLERHLDRLEDAGLVIRKRKYARVRLYFNPIVLGWFEPKKYAKISSKLSTIFLEKETETLELKTAQNQPVTNFKTTTCRIMYISGNIINILNTVVNKNNTAPRLVTDSETKPNYQEQREITEKFLTNAKSRAKIASEKQAARRRKKLEKCAMRIWGFAYKELYAPQLGKQLDFLAISQEDLAVKFFKDQLDQFPDRELNQQMHGHLYRLKQWRNWIRKDKVDGFTPLPSKFLDPLFQQGYKATLDWQRKNDKRSHYNSLVNQVNHWIRKIQQYYTFNKSFDELNTLRVETYRRLKAMLAQERNRKNRLVTNTQIEFIQDLFDSRVNEVIKSYLA